jgi:hypothetical protein
VPGFGPAIPVFRFCLVAAIPNYPIQIQEKSHHARFYEHILRSAEDIQGVCYIRLNPVRRGLSVDAHDYPLSGSQTIEWVKKIGTTTEWVPLLEGGSTRIEEKR